MKVRMLSSLSASADDLIFFIEFIFVESLEKVEEVILEESVTHYCSPFFFIQRSHGQH